MEEMFLNDYNNVALAQEPTGLAAVQNQPGFENYTPSFENQSLTPMGLADPQGTQLPDFREMAKNIATNTAKNYMIKKIGLEGIKGNVLKSVIGASSFASPIGAMYTMGSLLPDGVKGIAEVLRSKRAEKSYNRQIQKQSINTLQQQIDTGQFGSASNQDSGRGENNVSAPAKSAPAATQSRHTSGPGGLHSGY
tara:strand:- start:10 stop:591 length:582 start_codon:yes stop_codon:yes gene_type:complete